MNAVTVKRELANALHHVRAERERRGRSLLRGWGCREPAARNENYLTFWYIWLAYISAKGGFMQRSGPGTMVLLSLCAGLMLLFSSGCATIITGADPDQRIRIRSQPPGAQVFVDGEHVGQTPLRMKVNRRQHHEVRIEKEGYHAYHAEMRPGFNWWVMGNIVLGGLIGVAIDFVSGAHRGLTPARIEARLVRDDAAYNGTRAPPPDEQWRASQARPRER